MPKNSFFLKNQRLRTKCDDLACSKIYAITVSSINFKPAHLKPKTNSTSQISLLAQEK